MGQRISVIQTKKIDGRINITENLFSVIFFKSLFSNHLEYSRPSMQAHKQVDHHSTRHFLKTWKSDANWKRKYLPQSNKLIEFKKEYQTLTEPTISILSFKDCRCVT